MTDPKDPSSAQDRYIKHLESALPTRNVGKYSLNRKKMVPTYGLNMQKYLYQRCRVPGDRRYSVAYGIVDPKTPIDWFYWYDEAIVTFEGKARFTVSWRPQFDKEEVYEVGPTDIFFVEKGTKVRWEALGGKPHVYMIMAVPAAARG